MLIPLVSMFFAYCIPIVVLVLLFQRLATIIDALRQLNATSQRVANAVEVLSRQSPISTE